MSLEGVCDSGAVNCEWVESRRSSGGLWPLDIRLGHCCRQLWQLQRKNVTSL